MDDRIVGRKPGYTQITSWEVFFGHSMTESSEKEYPSEAMLATPFFIFLLIVLVPSKRVTCMVTYEITRCSNPGLTTLHVAPEKSMILTARWSGEPCLTIKSLPVKGAEMYALIVAITSCDVVATSFSSTELILPGA